jgi:hypothetical protein
MSKKCQQNGGIVKRHWAHPRHRCNGPDILLPMLYPIFGWISDISPRFGAFSVIPAKYTLGLCCDLQTIPPQVRVLQGGKPRPDSASFGCSQTGINVDCGSTLAEFLVRICPDPRSPDESEVCQRQDRVVPEVGLEPTRLAAEDFESSASTIPPLGHGRSSTPAAASRQPPATDYN